MPSNIAIYRNRFEQQTLHNFAASSMGAVSLRTSHPTQHLQGRHTSMSDIMYNHQINQNVLYRYTS